LIANPRRLPRSRAMTDNDVVLETGGSFGAIFPSISILLIILHPFATRIAAKKNDHFSRNFGHYDL